MRETIQNANGKQFHAVSLSGGKDSTAMLLLMIEQDMPIDMVLSADPREHHPRLEYESLSHGGAVQFRFHHRQPLRHAGQSRFSRRPLKAVIFHARFREKGFDTDETPPCLHHRSVERERV